MKRRSIIIELTALLDVVLILLFAILVNGSSQVEAAQLSAQQSQSAASEAQAQLSALRGELSRTQLELEATREELAANERAAISIGLLEENCLVVTISVNDARRITVECGGKKTAFTAEWENNYAQNALRALLIQYANAAPQAVFIVFQYDRNSIYNADYRLVSGAIGALKSRGNVYTVEYDKNTGG